ncbi:hypothetical protein GIB67_000282 [Kingdonia uniflora]|uniref:Vacuolar protein 8 n=1 Tax=Kingdonia uniflora TaxID=39325 RepID=A0A7J7LCI1_9MAGN|nr:hypothetical protein GIB67_000282 [Kingdonia uniflora]
MYEKKIAEMIEQLEDEHARSRSAHEQLAVAKQTLIDHQMSIQVQVQNDIDELAMKLKEMCHLHEKTVNAYESLKTEHEKLLSEKTILNEELRTMKEKSSVEEKQRKYLEDECAKLKRLASENDSRVPSELSTPTNLLKHHQARESISGQRATIAKIFEEVGPQKVVAMLRSEDLEVQIHALKMVANLAAEDLNQGKIVEEGGIDALLMLLESSQNTTIHRVASGAIANLAMSDMNQVLIMSKGGAQLLANVASKSNDPQTLRMVAGAIANLCGNQKLHEMLIEDDGIKALLGMAQCGNSDVIAQVARGLANFAKCESRATVQGYRSGRSLLMEDGALSWLITNSIVTLSSTRRHIELAICHLAQNDDNAQDFISTGAAKELSRISLESSREDIRNLAKKTLAWNTNFQVLM